MKFDQNFLHENAKFKNVVTCLQNFCLNVLKVIVDLIVFNSAWPIYNSPKHSYRKGVLISNRKNIFQVLHTFLQIFWYMWTLNVAIIFTLYFATL